MSKGFLILADNSSNIDYVRMAYAAALSIKNTQLDIKNVSLITNGVVEVQQIAVFDKIIDLDWNQNFENSRFKIDHRSKIYNLTPYDETIVLDADVLVLNDLSNYWKKLEKFEVFYPTTVLNYRGDVISSNYYRKTIVENNLPNVYSAFYYFKKSEKSKEFYSLVEFINENWESFYSCFLKKYPPKRPSMDVSTAIATKILEYDFHEAISFVHMKPMIQDWKFPTEKWQDSVGVYFNEKCSLKVGNYLQQNIFHYTEKEFLTDKIIKKLENYEK